MKIKSNLKTIKQKKKKLKKFLLLKKSIKSKKVNKLNLKITKFLPKKRISLITDIKFLQRNLIYQLMQKVSHQKANLIRLEKNLKKNTLIIKDLLIN